MVFCPECGGEMKYMPATKRLACKSCGLSLFELRQQLRPKFESDDEKRNKQRREYLKWWLGKKK